jgi:hypothetical protein
MKQQAARVIEHTFDSVSLLAMMLLILLRGISSNMLASEGFGAAGVG